MSKPNNLVIVVDNDPVVCHALQFSLALEGFRVLTCCSGADLLSHEDLKRSGCIVLDHKMPDMSGLEVLKHLSEANISTPVIFISGPVSRSVSARAIEAGAKCVLEKPLLDKALPERIRELTIAGS